MEQRRLSLKAQAASAAVNNLSQEEQARVVSLPNADLAATIAGAAGNSTLAKRAKAFAKVVEGVAAATTPQKNVPVSEIKNINGYNGVVGQITVNGQQLDTLLSEGSFGKSRSDLHSYAAELGYRMATHAEHRAYVESLLAKEEDNSINEAEANALKTYRDRYVRDDQGGLDVVGRSIIDVFDLGWNGYDVHDRGALFVRASAESK